MDSEFIKPFRIKNIVKPVGRCATLKFESAATIILTICIFLSLYFALLSFQEINDASKGQFVTFAAYFLVMGIVILTCMIVYTGVKRAFPKMESRLKNSKEPPEPEET